MSRRAMRKPPRGDEADLFRAHNGELVRSLVTRLRVSREVAEDAAQFAWAQLYRRHPDRETVGGWLYVVARNEAFSLLARSRREPALEQLPEAAVEPRLEEFVNAAATLALLEKLKPQQRLVLWLFAEGYSYKETCRLTGRTYTWVIATSPRGGPRSERWSRPRRRGRDQGRAP